MTREQKRRFIRELVQSVQNTCLDAVDKMPEEWDGHELRVYVADKFRDSAYIDTQRRRAYHRAIATLNI